MIQVCTVYDTAAARFLDPFTAPTIEFAIREFRRAVNEPGHQFNRYPEDYALFHVGQFNPDSGELQHMAPRSLGVALTFKVQTPAPPQLDLLTDEAANG